LGYPLKAGQKQALVAKSCIIGIATAIEPHGKLVANCLLASATAQNTKSQAAGKIPSGLAASRAEFTG
jgi:hypothetical protein